jgi:hypothetical protein
VTVDQAQAILRSSVRIDQAKRAIRDVSAETLAGKTAADVTIVGLATELRDAVLEMNGAVTAALDPPMTIAR